MLISYTSTDRILCIVNFNWPHYANIPIFKRLYQDFFPHMVFYGADEHPEVISIDHTGFVGPNPFVPEVTGGFFGYKDIADAMRRYPDYDGYLFTNDDCFINIANFKRLDISKIWFLPLIPVEKNTAPVWFWNTPGSWPAVAKCYDNLPVQYKEKLYTNISSEQSCWAMSDLVYIPARFKDDTIYLCDLFARNGLWLEIAIPHICACLDNQKNFEMLKALYCQSAQYTNLQETIQRYNSTFDFVHPIKLSDPNAVQFAQEQLAKCVE